MFFYYLITDRETINQLKEARKNLKNKQNIKEVPPVNKNQVSQLPKMGKNTNGQEVKMRLNDQ